MAEVEEKPEPKFDIEEAKAYLDKATDEERLELFFRYCRFCGSKNKGCVCWRDD